MWVFVCCGTNYDEFQFRDVRLEIETGHLSSTSERIGREPEKRGEYPYRRWGIRVIGGLRSTTTITIIMTLHISKVFWGAYCIWGLGEREDRDLETGKVIWLQRWDTQVRRLMVTSGWSWGNHSSLQFLLPFLHGESSKCILLLLVYKSTLASNFTDTLSTVSVPSAVCHLHHMQFAIMRIHLLIIYNYII